MSWRSRLGIGGSRRSTHPEPQPSPAAAHTEAATRVRLSGERRTREQVEAMLPGEVDFRGLDLSGIDFRPTEGAPPLTFTDARFGSHPPEKEHPPTKLTGTAFRGCTLTNCSFAHVILDDADFRGCTLEKCDFRYAIFRRVTFEDATLGDDCDLYRSVFEIGCVMAKTVLRGVSLTHAWLYGVVDLRRSSFEAAKDEPALKAEADADSYFGFLEKTEKDRSRDFPIDDAVRDAPEEAARVYRHLSGVWSAQGHYDDATWAYVRSKDLERRFAKARGRDRSLARADRIRAWRTVVVLFAADRLCRFGDSLTRVALWIAAVAIIPGLVYWLTAAIKTHTPATTGTGEEVHDAGLFLSLMFSLGRLADITPNGLATSTRVVDGFAIAQTIVALTLIGLLGFVLGNKLRSS